MIDFIHIYSNIQSFSKLNYKKFREEKLPNTKSLSYIELYATQEETLILPSPIKENIDINAVNLIVLNSFPASGPFTKTLHFSDTQNLMKDKEEFGRQYFFIKQPEIPQNTGIFKVVKPVSDYYEWYLEYEKNSYFIGLPQRANHKLFHLKRNETLQYKINGKADFTMTGRKERTYYEHEYILEWKGSYKQVKFTENFKTEQKNITHFKTVNERKILF